jgi:16S rRNA (guanine527-N7)-methyltransferase
MPSLPPPANRLNQLLEAAGHPRLAPETAEKFAAYLTLLQKWNAKTNLTAIRDEEGILSRHFLESILCARSLPENVSSLLDFGSGAGFPGLPIAIIRSEIAVTLAESQNKKAAFLREAVRTLGLSVKVHAARAETLAQKFDVVTLRAVDNMAAAIPAAFHLLNPTGWLAVLTTTDDAPSIESQASQSANLTWLQPKPLPPGTNRILLIGQAII